MAFEIIEGGLAALDTRALTELVRTLPQILRHEHIDVLVLPSLPVDSAFFLAFGAFGRPLDRLRFADTWERHRVVLPSTMNEYLASRSWETRRGIRKNASRIERAFGGDVQFTVLREPAHFDQLLSDLELVSQKTYQRAGGGGFADTSDQRALARVGLVHGWIRAYVLYHAGKPIAYWFGSIHGETLVLRTTGFDPAYGAFRVGAYALARLIEDACADPLLSVIDFGPGRSSYKRHFSTETRLEGYLSVYAPTFHARGINAVQTLVLGSARLATAILDRLHLTEWARRNLRRAAS